MKKRFIILTAAVLAASITACQPRTGDTVSSSAVEETTLSETEDETETAAEGQTGAEAENAEAAEMLDNILDELKQTYGENYVPNMTYDSVSLIELFELDESWYDAIVAEGPAITTQVETIIGVHAIEGRAETVAAALEKYRRRQIEEAFQYPMNMPKLEASQVVTHGDYVFFVMLGGADQEALDQDEEAALASAVANNQKAIDVIDSFFQS